MKKIIFRIVISILCIGILVAAAGCSSKNDTQPTSQKQESQSVLESESVNEINTESLSETVLTESETAGTYQHPESQKVDLVSTYNLNPSSKVIYKKYVGKSDLPTKEITGKIKSDLFRCLSKKTFNIVKSWEPKVSYRVPEYQFELKHEDKSIFLNFCCIYEGKGYMSVLEGKEYKLFELSEDDYKSIIGLGNES